MYRWVWCKVPPGPLGAIFCIASARSCVRGRRSNMHHGVRGGDTMAYHARFAQAGHVTDIHRDPRAFRARDRRYSHPRSGRARSHAPSMRTCVCTRRASTCTCARPYAYACTCTMHIHEHARPSLCPGTAREDTAQEATASRTAAVARALLRPRCDGNGSAGTPEAGHAPAPAPDTDTCPGWSV